MILSDVDITGAMAELVKSSPILIIFAFIVWKITVLFLGAIKDARVEHIQATQFAQKTYTDSQAAQAAIFLSAIDRIQNENQASKSLTRDAMDRNTAATKELTDRIDRTRRDKTGIQ